MWVHNVNKLILEFRFKNPYSLFITNLVQIICVGLYYCNEESNAVE